MSAWPDEPAAGMRAPELRSPRVWAVPLIGLIGMACLQGLDANRSVFAWFNGLSKLTGAAPWAWMTVLGDTVVALALFGPLAVRRPQLMWALALSALIATLFVHGIKPVLLWPRPPAVLPPESITVIGPALTRKSFPSGHTATAFVAAGLVWMHVRSPLVRWTALCVAAGVGVSRMVVGVHWPMDVLAGAVFGWVAAWLGSLLSARLRIGRHLGLRITLIAVIAGCALAALTVLDTGYSQARWVQQTVGALSLCALTFALMRLRRSV